MNVGDAALHRLFDTLERLPWPNPLMGKPEVDEQRLIEAVDHWIAFLPAGDVEEHLRQTEAEAGELSARAQLALAAAAWAYWKRDPYLTAQAIEARRAETHSGSVHESAVGNADAPKGDRP